ncbi:MAG: pyridoxamine 5'-phosphate oxidase family protein [Xanthomonadales bacterium]|nr:pyridoxamine 5'-phosphate oxidase family protein [Xanthomonadales bacterium]
MSPAADTRHRREKERGGHEFDTAAAIIDEARICHVGIEHDGQVYVLPMACARDGQTLLLHGSVASRLMKGLAKGLHCCATITHLDGLVYARSAFHSSMNYRSVMIFGQARLVEDADAKSRGLDRLVEQLLPGRLAELRPSTSKELKATHLLALPIEVFSTKVRTGPPEDPKTDLDQPVWAGELPLETRAGKAIDAPDLAVDAAVPRYVSGLSR